MISRPPICMNFLHIPLSEVVQWGVEDWARSLAPGRTLDDGFVEARELEDCRGWEIRVQFLMTQKHSRIVQHSRTVRTYTIYPVIEEGVVASVVCSSKELRVYFAEGYTRYTFHGDPRQDREGGDVLVNEHGFYFTQGATLLRVVKESMRVLPVLKTGRNYFLRTVYCPQYVVCSKPLRYHSHWFSKCGRVNFEYLQAQVLDAYTKKSIPYLLADDGIEALVDA